MGSWFSKKSSNRTSTTSSKYPVVTKNCAIDAHVFAKYNNAIKYVDKSDDVVSNNHESWEIYIEKYDIPELLIKLVNITQSNNRKDVDNIKLLLSDHTIVDAFDMHNQRELYFIDSNKKMLFLRLINKSKPINTSDSVLTIDLNKL